MTINLKISGQTLTVDAPELAEKSIGKLFCVIDADAEWDGLTMRLIFRSVSKVNLIARQTVVTDRASVEVPAEVIRQGYLYINAVGVADGGAVQLTTGDMEVPFEIKSVTGLSAATGTAVSPTQYDELLSLIGDLSANLGAVEELASSNEGAIGTIGEALAKMSSGTQIVRGASTDGAAYTATGDDLPNVVIGSGGTGGKGSQIVFIPDAANISAEPTLQINGGGVVRIALRASENQGDNDLSPSATVTVPVGALMRGVPYTMTFCGAYWLVDSAIGADLFCANTGEEATLMRAVAAKTVELESGGEIAVPVVDPLDVGASHNIGYVSVNRTKAEQLAAMQTGRTEIPSVGTVEAMIEAALKEFYEQYIQ